MNIAVAQVNTTIGDIQGNTARICRLIDDARRADARLLVVPELAVCGYPPQDLAERPAFLQANEQAVRRIARAADGIYVAIGHLACSHTRPGKRATNSASLVCDGRILARRDKMLLPTYDVFDEARYFQPGAENEPVCVEERLIALAVCEDAWNDRHFWPERLYDTDPVEQLVGAGAELILNLSASPFSVGRQQFRRRMLCASARRHGIPLVYANLVGGNDQLIFDGRSLAIDAEGRIIAEGAAFEEDLMLIDSDAHGAAMPPALPSEVEDIWRALILGLRDYVHKCGFQRVVFGISGGIDSAVTAALAAEALGADNVMSLFMPTRISSTQSRQDAHAVARNLGIGFHILPIESTRLQMEESLSDLFAGTERGVAEENIQARIRGNLVMAYANKFHCLALATGNKSELAVGYCTLYGDMVGGLAVIGDVPKTMVYELARYANRDGEVIPRSILEKPPSAELKPDQTDQDVLPPYEVLDGILTLYVEENREYHQIVEEGYDPETVRRVLAMVDRAEFKRRQAPITLRVTRKAFGPGRRLPVAQNWPR